MSDRNPSCPGSGGRPDVVRHGWRDPSPHAGGEDDGEDGEDADDGEARRDELQEESGDSSKQAAPSADGTSCLLNPLGRRNPLDQACAPTPVWWP